MPHQNNTWEKVYETFLEHRANLVCDWLANQSIIAVVMNKKDSSYHFGRYEVYTAPQDITLAKFLIENEIKFE